MAFLQNKYQNPTLSESGGMAGDVSAPEGKQKTTAGTPSGWYNIQDFLGANTQAPAIKSQIEQKGASQLDEAKNKYQTQLSNLQSMPTPDKFTSEGLSGITQGGVTSGEAQTLANKLSQQPTGDAFTKTAAEQMPSIASPYSSMKSGDFSSIMNWFGDQARPASEYTPGMQKTDEMLLRGQQGFAEEYPTKLQNQFQAEVQNPLEAKRQEITKAQDTSKGAFEDANKQWYQGITGFLSDEKNKISNMYDQQKQQLADINAKNTKDIMGADYYARSQDYPTYDTSPGGNKPYIGMPEYQLRGIEGVNPSNFITRSNYVAPSQETAATGALGQEGIDTYNTLAGLVGDTNTISGSPQAFDPGTWNFDQKGFENDYKRVVQELALQNIADQMGKISNLPYAYIAPGTTISNTYRDNIPTLVDPELIRQGADPAYSGQNLQYYDIPYYVDSPYGRVNINLPNAGTRWWQNSISPSPAYWDKPQTLI
jgi:hypothetical protein